MKKIALTVIGALAVTGSVFAQGTVNFASFIPTNIGASTNATVTSSFVGGGAGAANGTTGLTGLATTGFYYELLWTANGASAPTTLAQLGTWTDSTFFANNSTASAGRLVAGNGNNGVALAGVPVNTTISVMLAGWSSNLGANYSAALATLNSPSQLAAVVGYGFFGVTTVGTVTPTTTTAPGATIFGTSPLIFSPNTQLNLVTPVPEPSTMALAAIGGASLLLFRRRK